MNDVEAGNERFDKGWWRGNAGLPATSSDERYLEGYRDGQRERRYEQAKRRGQDTSEFEVMIIL